MELDMEKVNSIKEYAKKKGLLPHPRLQSGIFPKQIINIDSLSQENEIMQDEKVLDYPQKNEKGKPLKTWENLNYLFEVNNIDIKYNVLSKEIEVSNSDNKSLDEILVEFNTLTLINNFRLSANDMLRFTVKIAKNNSYNPIINFLEKCEKKWDSKSRLKEICDTIKTSGDNTFKEKLIIKWLVNAVHIAYNKGQNNCEGVLVLQGEQGIGKTRWIRSLVPNQSWLKTGVSVDPDNKDSVMKCTKYWIVELGEMDATLKKEQAVLKQFFTENSDEYREPYAKSSFKFPRLTCFYATVNDQEFLKDTTGNRRYWSINVTDINIDHGIDLEQLWGEVATLYKNKKITTWLDAQELKELCDNNEKFEVKSSIEIKILESYMWNVQDIAHWSYYTSTEIAEYINEKSPIWVGKTIKKLMKSNDSIKFDSNGRQYLLPPKKTESYIYKKYIG